MRSLLDLHYMTFLGLGFLLGARHALDADHLAAVSTILSDRPTLRASGLIGFCWGLGHTVMLLLVGLAVIGLQMTIPERVAQAIEFGVGGMLVVLGVSLAVTLMRERWHVHAHQHGGATHLHFHSHSRQAGHAHPHWLQVSVKPLVVGMVHGLAGSAALMFVVLSSVRTAWEGAAYILVFGLGSIVGMVAVGMAISFPLVFSASLGRHAQLTVQGLASLGSIGLGLAMMVRIGLGEGLF
ncbi:MAG: urease accessory protein UreH [Nitrospira sp.]|nr:urease accessory protein UreH [Nitrospira sp.]